MWGAMPYVGLQSTRYMYYLDQTLQLKGNLTFSIEVAFK